MLYAVPNRNGSKLSSVMRPLVNELITAAYSSLPSDYQPPEHGSAVDVLYGMEGVPDDQPVTSMLPYFELTQR